MQQTSVLRARHAPSTASDVVPTLEGTVLEDAATGQHEIHLCSLVKIAAHTLIPYLPPLAPNLFRSQHKATSVMRLAANQGTTARWVVQSELAKKLNDRRRQEERGFGTSLSIRRWVSAMVCDDLRMKPDSCREYDAAKFMIFRMQLRAQHASRHRSHEALDTQHARPRHLSSYSASLFDVVTMLPSPVYSP